MLDVLQNKGEIASARRHMEENGRSALESRTAALLRRLRLNKSLPVGDRIKSWDVARTLSFIDQNLAKDATVLDLGAFCSEVPVALAQMNFKGVHAIDLNPRVRAMPFADRVNYCIGDFMKAPFPDSTFDAVTAISVIEHGYEPDRLFSEVARLLRPAGYLIASFDYWPEKIDTGNTLFFDMSWRIFSQGDVMEALRIAKGYGLEPVGPLKFESGESAVECMGFRYTFGWLALRKAP